MARRLMEKLTALEAKRLTKPGFHSDGAGLYLRIEDGRRLWVFRYMLGGKARWMSLGPDRVVTLKEAREKASECRRQLLDKIDPIEAREAKRGAVQIKAGVTFEAAAQLFIESKKSGWRNEKHGKQWESTLKLYAYPLIGHLAVEVVTVTHILAILKPIWAEKPETASRVRGRIENVLDYATALDWRKGENPARWKGRLDHTLPARAKVAKVEHHAALPWSELPATMAKLASSQGMGALCLRFLVLTAARSGEARGALWNEIDMDAKTWTVPGKRMKAGNVHRVPLSYPAIEILTSVLPLKRSLDGLVFPGGRLGSPLSDVALSKALAAAGTGAFTVHGMRSTFRDWSAENTTYPREIAEAALAHTNRDKTEAAYLRGDHFEKRRRLMIDWAEYAARPNAAGVAISTSSDRADSADTKAGLNTAAPPGRR